jgi:hypothetical protein
MELGGSSRRRKCRKLACCDDARWLACSLLTISLDLIFSQQVDPFPAAGSVAAAKGTCESFLTRRATTINGRRVLALFVYSFFLAEAASGVFRPVPPFRNLASIPQNAIYFGSILAWQRLCCKSLELVRRKEDLVNEAFGLGMVYPYYLYILNHSEKRLVRHNRVVGGVVVASAVYATLFA